MTMPGVRRTDDDATGLRADRSVAHLDRAVALLELACEAIRAATAPPNALAEAATELAEASTFVTRALATRVSTDDDPPREVLEEALACTRAATSAVRFALAAAGDGARPLRA